MQTVSFEDARLVATMCQRSENCPLGQVSWKGLFSNCYVTGRVLFRWGRGVIFRGLLVKGPEPFEKEISHLGSGSSGRWNDRSRLKSTSSLQGVRFRLGTCVK